MKKKKTWFMVIAICFCLTFSTVALQWNSNREVNGLPWEHVGDLHASTLAAGVQLSNTPAITFLTHGLAGQASHWSNSMHRDNQGNWIVETVDSRNQPFAYDPDSLIEKIRVQMGGIKLYVADIQEEELLLKEYILIGNHYEDPPTLITTLTDFTKHTVVVFNLYEPATNKAKTNEQIYNAMHRTIDKISADFMQETGYLPRINLIGHSRGGLHNMDYAIEHPYNVASLISIGTPYNGTWYGNPFAPLLNLNDDAGSIGMQDIVSSSKIAERKYKWNQIHFQTSHINFRAISGTISLSFANHMIYGPFLADYLGIAGALGIQALFSTTYLANLIGGLIPGDIAVDKSSQQAENYNGVIAWNKDFKENNSNFDKRTMNEIPYPHNLETYDNDIHQYILSNTEFGIPRNFCTASLSDSTVQITGLTYQVQGTLHIPSQINGKTVTSVGNSAFRYQANLSGVIIPNTVTSIGEHAFSGCYALSSVTFASDSQLSSIGGWAFDSCSSLTSIMIPSGVTNIEAFTFYSCYRLTSVSFQSNNTLQSIGKGAFGYCTDLQNISIPSSVTNIGDSAFQTCTNLSSIVIPSGVTNIPEWTFAHCSNLESVMLPSNVQNIRQFAFAYCANLQNISLPSNLINIGDNAFRFCTSLTEIIIPRNVWSIGEEAFAYCVSLQEVALSQPYSIGDYAFQYCTSLSGITIPRSVNRIGNRAFRECHSLDTVILQRPSSSGLTELGYLAFEGTSLNHIFVPNGSEAAYASAANWSSFSIIPMEVVTFMETAFSYSSESIYFSSPGYKIVLVPNVPYPPTLPPNTYFYIFGTFSVYDKHGNQIAYTSLISGSRGKVEFYAPYAGDYQFVTNLANPSCSGSYDAVFLESPWQTQSIFYRADSVNDLYSGPAGSSPRIVTFMPINSGRYRILFHADGLSYCKMRVIDINTSTVTVKYGIEIDLIANQHYYILLDTFAENAWSGNFSILRL